MPAGGKVIIEVEGLLGSVALGGRSLGAGLRERDPRTGAVFWITTPIPTQLTEPWGGQKATHRVAAGNILVTEVQPHGAKQVSTGPSSI